MNNESSSVNNREKANYWWVNHSHTYEKERDQGLMWSPKRSKRGRYNRFYENVTNNSIW